MQIPMMRTDRLYHVTANWLTNTQKRYTRDFLICAENKQDAEKITRNHIPNQFLTTNNPTDTTDIHIRVRDLGLSQKNRTYYVSPIQETTRVIADEPSILEETATYFARLFGYEQGALASKSELTNTQSARLTSLNTLCKDAQMFWKLAGEFLYLKNADPTNFCRKKIEELTNTVNLDELANESNTTSAPKSAPTSVDTSAILNEAKKQADFIIAQAKETAEIIINNAKQTAHIITANATNISANVGAMMPQEHTNSFVETPANLDDELPFGEPDESIVQKKPSATPEPTEELTPEPVEESVDTNDSVAEPAQETTADDANTNEDDTTENTSDITTESTTEPTTNEEPADTDTTSDDTETSTNTDTNDVSTKDDTSIIEEHMKELVSTDIQSIQTMSDETLLKKTLSALQDMSDDEFLTTIADTTFVFESTITPTEYFESELNKNTDFNDEAKTSTKASILASIKGDTDHSMLIDYAISLIVKSKNEDTLEDDNQFFTDNTDDGFDIDDDESYEDDPSYEEEPEYTEDDEGNSDI